MFLFSLVGIDIRCIKHIYCLKISIYSHHRKTTPYEVPERVVCSIASGMWQECCEIDDEMPLQSSKFLKTLNRASTTKHEHLSRKAFEDAGLKVKAPVSLLELGLKRPLPWLKVSDLIRTMALHEKLDKCLFGGCGPNGLNKFWNNYRRLWPEHPVFRRMSSDDSLWVPIYLHADEGRYLKKEQILLFNFQSALGFGTSLSRDAGQNLEESQGVNILGSCYSTRFLIGTLLSQHYRKKNRDGHRLQALLNAITTDILEVYTHGVQVNFHGKWVTLYVVPLGLKGDWPMLAKLGNLSRSFSRKGRPKPDSCVCHLCGAGAPGVPYHDHEIGAAWYESYLKTRPWTTPSKLMRLPTLPSPEQFYCFDIFHVCHKGIYAELAASALDPRLLVSFLFFSFLFCSFLFFSSLLVFSLLFSFLFFSFVLSFLFFFSVLPLSLSNIFIVCFSFAAFCRLVSHPKYTWPPFDLYYIYM